MKKVLLIFVIGLFATASILAQTPAVVTPPTNLQVKFQTSNNLLPVLNNKLTWTASTTLNAKYVLYRSESLSNGTVSNFFKIASELRHTEFFDYQIRGNSKYGYFAVAYLSGLNGGFSKPSDTIYVSTEIQPLTYAFVSGAVTNDSDSSPLKNAFVSFIPTQGGCKNSAFFKTDSMGKYVGKIVASEYIIYSSAAKFVGEYFDNQKYYTSATKVTIKEKDSLTFNVGLAKYVEPAKYTLSGKVTDSTGKGLRADVFGYRIRSNAKYYSTGVAKTDSLGNYSFKVYQGDTVVVYAYSKDKNLVPEFYNNQKTFADANRVGVAGDVNNIDFVLDPKPVYNNSISGSVKNKSGAVVFSHLALFEIKDGRFVNRKLSTHSDSTTGVYTFKNINPGKYIMFAHPKENYKPTYYRYDSKQTLNWKEADSIVVDATSALANFNFTVLAPGDTGLAVISGNVKNPQGNVEVGALVYALDANNEVVGYGITNNFGNYAITELEPGTYNVTVDKVGYTAPTIVSTTINYSLNPVATQSFIITPNLILNTGNEKLTPQSFKLEQNYPNPFNPSTKISFSIPIKNNVELRIYNIIGKEIATLANGSFNAGSYDVIWDAQNISSGVYFYTLKVGSFKETRKMILMK